MGFHDDDGFNYEDYEDDYIDSDFDEYDDDSHYERHENEGDLSESNTLDDPPEYPLLPKNWKEMAFLGAMSEEIAGVTARRRRELNEDKNKDQEKDFTGVQSNSENTKTGRLKNTDNLSDINPQHPANKNPTNIAGERQKNNPRQTQDFNGIFSFAIAIFIVFLMIRSCV